MSPEDRLIVALDVADRCAADGMLERLSGSVRWIKVGSVLFSSCGPDLVRDCVGRGFRVFLDLKLHDIPHQVGLTASALAELGVALLTVHTSGGPAMLEAARRAVRDSDAGVLGVTVLTSHDRETLSATGVAGELEEVVLQRARLARDCGLDGVVASARELVRLRAEVPELPVVTPGIRPAGVEAGDQRRTATPAEAISAGASRLVVGRPIVASPDPAAAAASMLAEIAKASTS